jgi:hypothetical protein
MFELFTEACSQAIDALFEEYLPANIFTPKFLELVPND